MVYELPTTVGAAGRCPVTRPGRLPTAPASPRAGIAHPARAYYRLHESAAQVRCRIDAGSTPLRRRPPGIRRRRRRQRIAAICYGHADADHHRRKRPLQDLRLAFPGAQERQSGYSPWRNLRLVGPQRCRQDDLDQHHLRDRHGQRRQRAGRRPRHRRRLPCPPRPDRPGAAGTDHGRFRVGVGDSAVACSASAPIPATSKSCCAICRCGTGRTAASSPFPVA